MIYERLLVARDLLKNDGVIFISVDDSEQSNLKKICDEVFGESNFYCHFIWQKRSGSMDSVDGVSIDHEYVLAYGKSKSRLAGVVRKYDKYTNPDNDPRGPWISDNLSAGKAGGDVDYPITDPQTGHVFFPPKGRYWPYNPKTMQQKIEEGRVLFPKNKNGRPMLKRFQNEAKSQFLPVSTLLRNHTEKNLPNNVITCAMNTKGTSEIQELFDSKIFSFPKSTILLKSLLGQVSFGNDIILDFFSGSATTAHAVMQLNAEDGGNRKFIMVQLPENTDENSEAYKNEYKTIAEIGKKRILLAGKKIVEALKEKNKQLKLGKEPVDISKLDIGFRVYKTDETNMKDVFYHPNELKQDQLDLLSNNIKEDRSPEDLLAQVTLDLGLELSLPMETKKILGNTVYIVQTNALVACFDNDINFKIINEIANLKPLKVVFKDSSFKDDKDRINVDERFKRLSPETKITVL